MTPIDRIVRSLERRDEVLFAFLFGSRAGGRPRPDSDWDLALYVREEVSPRQRWNLRLSVAAELDQLGPVDVVVLNDAPPLLAHRAIQGRRLVVRDKSALVRFVLRTLALADDQRHWAEIHIAAQLRRLREGRFGRPKRL